MKDNDETKLSQWQINYNKGEYASDDLTTMCAAGWYDWFCKDSSLKRKLDKMAKIIMKIKDSSRVNLDTMYVFFKNNCPMCYPLYDDFRICDIESGDVIYCISIDCEYENAKYAIYGRENKFDKPLFTCGKSKELVAWLNEEVV